MLNSGSTSVLPQRSDFQGHGVETLVFMTKLTFWLSAILAFHNQKCPEPFFSVQNHQLTRQTLSHLSLGSSSTEPIRRRTAAGNINRWPPCRGDHKPAVLSYGEDDVQRSYLRRTFRQEEPSCSRHDNMEALVQVWRPLITSNLTAESWPTGIRRYLYAARNTNTQLPI